MGSKNRSTDPVFCPECGFKNELNSAFCQNCGRALTQDLGQNQAEKPLVKTKKKKAGRWFLTVSVSAAVIGTAAFGVSRMKGMGGETEIGFTYEKDNCLYYVSGKKTLELSDRIAVDGDNSSNIHSRVEYSEDGRYVYYTAKRDSFGSTLYRRDLKKDSEKNDTEEKISSNVSLFQVCGDRVFYTKNLDNGFAIYMYEDGEDIKLAKDASYWLCSEDGQSLMWMDTDQTLYYMGEIEKGNEKKVDSSCASVAAESPDLKLVYYLDSNQNLYCSKEGEKEKIASHVDMVIPYGGDRYVYYTTQGDPFSLMSLIEDDMAKADAAMTEPRREDYIGNSRIYNSLGYDQYNQAYREYERKIKRDELRRQLAEADTDIERVNLYVYDGRESRLLAENAWDCHQIQVCSNVLDQDSLSYEPALYVGDYEEEAFARFKLSNLSDANLQSRFYDWIDRSGLRETGMFIAEGCVLEMEGPCELEDYFVDTKNRILYHCISDEPGWDGYAEYVSLEKIPFSEKGFGTPVELDDDFNGIANSSRGGMRISNAIVRGKQLIYLTDYDYERSEGSLRCDGQELNDETGFIFHKNGRIFFCYDSNASRDASSLGEIQDGKILEVGEEVYIEQVCDDGTVVFLSDYDTERGEGDLYIWKKGKATLLEEDVSYLVDF